MEIQTMGAQGVNSTNAGKPLPRQNSMYSLTLDEVQTHLGDLGKPLSSMNLDELLKSVWIAESNLSLGSEAPSTDQSLLSHQPSLSLTGPLSKKTVDELWRDIQQWQNGSHEKASREKQSTLGEMTLEDFLTKAGAVAEGVLETENDGALVGFEQSASQQFPPTVQGPWMQYQQSQFQHAPQGMMEVYMPGSAVAQSVSMGTGSVMEMPFAENQISVPSSIMGNLSDTQGSSRKRVAPEDIANRSVERRQKRMIKNRESAARSRARKQAYTNELESKVSRLKEENERLKRRKELENLLPCAPPAEPTYQLRRTSSSHF